MEFLNNGIYRFIDCNTCITCKDFKFKRLTNKKRAPIQLLIGAKTI